MLDLEGWGDIRVIRRPVSLTVVPTIGTAVCSNTMITAIILEWYWRTFLFNI